MHPYRQLANFIMEDVNLPPEPTTPTFSDAYMRFRLQRINSVCPSDANIDDLGQERRNSSALPMVLRRSCTNPLISCALIHPMKNVNMQECMFNTSGWIHLIYNRVNMGSSGCEIIILHMEPFHIYAGLMCVHINLACISYINVTVSKHRSLRQFDLTGEIRDIILKDLHGRPNC